MGYGRTVVTAGVLFRISTGEDGGGEGLGNDKGFLEHTYRLGRHSYHFHTFEGLACWMSYALMLGFPFALDFYHGFLFPSVTNTSYLA